MMPHPSRFFDGQLQDMFRSRGEFNPPPAMSTNPSKSLNHFLYTGRFKPQLPQHPTGDTTFLSDETKQYVFRADVVMMQAFCLFVC
jgi:hypothetical protein